MSMTPSGNVPGQAVGNAAEEAARQTAGAPGEAPAAAVASPAAGTPPAPQDELQTLRQEMATLQDQNLRLIAESRNQQQRIQRETAEALKYAEADFARELLVVADDLARTMESVNSGGAATALLDGVRIVADHFLKVLKGRGIEPIDAVGKPFDPRFHEALLQQPSDDHPAGIVLQEVARGYRMHERVLRPSRVIVSSGPASPPPPAAGEPPTAGREK